MTTKILTPTEWEKLEKNLNPYYQIICNAMLYTGLRPDSEFWRFIQNPQWYKHGKITIPYINSLQQARVIPLSIKGREAVEVLISFTHTINNKRKEKNTIRDALRRAASGDGRTTARIGGVLKKVKRSPVISTEGLSANTFRKTIITWLVSCYPEKKYEVLIAMGIDEENFGQYIGRPFDKKDLVKMRVLLEGWVK